MQDRYRQKGVMFYYENRCSFLMLLRIKLSVALIIHFLF